MTGAASRIGRGIVAAVFLGMAGTGIALGTAGALDDQDKPELARALSGKSRQDCYLDLGQQLTTGKQPLSPEQIDWVRRDLARHPLAGMPIYLAGASRALGGDLSGGRRLVGLSIRRDPRLLPPHYWIARTEMEQQHAAEATQATLRIMVLSPDSSASAIPVLVALTRFPESWPYLRKALASDDAYWHEPYFSALVRAGFDPSVVFSVIDVANKKSRRRPDPSQQTSLLSSMIANGDYERAYTAWLGWLPPEALARVAFLYDGDFQGAVGAAPFNWTLLSGQAGSAEIDKGRGLRFDLTTRDPLVLASQTILLQPGRYRFRVTAMLDEGAREGEPVPLEWHLRCLSGKQQSLMQIRLPNSTDARSAEAVFEVPTDCPAQSLSFDASASEFPMRTGGVVRSVTLSQVK